MDLSKLPGMSSVERAVGKIDLVRAYDSMDKAVRAGRIEIKRRRESLRPTVVVTYRGWYADGVAHLTARAIEKPILSPAEAAGASDMLKTQLRRFLVLSIEGVSVRASMGAASAIFTSDDAGFLDISLNVGPLGPGWHVLDIDAVDGEIEVTHTTGRVFVPDPAGGLAVVSDIDDTILKTGLTQRWTVPTMRTLRDVADRKTVPGMSAFYAGITRGTGQPRSVPFYYVSTGSWALYDYLVAFLNMNRFPRGPLFLTDWGPSSQRIMRDGKEHKRNTMRALIAGNPNYKFILVGDVGQGDPESYEVMAREFGDQVQAIFLISVGNHLPERTEEIASRAARLREEGIQMFYVEDAVEAATAAWQLGLVDKQTAIEAAVEVQAH